MIGETFFLGFKVYKEEYDAFIRKYGTTLMQKFSTQYTAENAKGRDCTLGYAMVLWLSFYYFILMKKDLTLGMSLEDAETKYNTARLKYILSCYNIRITDMYDIFDINSFIPN